MYLSKSVPYTPASPNNWNVFQLHVIYVLGISVALMVSLAVVKYLQFFFNDGGQRISLQRPVSEITNPATNPFRYVLQRNLTLTHGHSAMPYNSLGFFRNITDIPWCRLTWRYYRRAEQIRYFI
ncbi:uncharacterized protein LOC119661820 [Teleopsis dalmanni]|uniref:uncharacterized protein LOC119661820 n=1 Tax=Teleopsis dalmanni TaxID=139649 RepID=UPI0018CE99C7|nr:uncharacterized protein LOC119661820 [Teleopsis dalmanni]